MSATAPYFVPDRVPAGRASVDTQASSRALAIADHLGLLVVALEVTFAWLVLHQLDLLSAAMQRVVLIAAGGLVVHALLPKRFRLAAFAAFCGAVLLTVMGGSPTELWDATQAALRVFPILLIVGSLIGICFLPLGFWTRAALCAGVGVAVTLARAGVIPAPSLAIVWPTIAGFVMFRGIVFFYQVATTGRRPSIAEAFGYLLLFPNVCVGLFPVVDFKTFVRSHYNSDALAIYQRGAHWISRGVVQLVIYRVVQQLAAIGAGDVASGRDLIQYMVSNSFLYLQVSGQFHLFVGLLLLFGFNLPETNHRYFLAASFTDYWRRVNIYWKDFIMGVFYFPSYFRLKRLGETKALVLATLWSFFVTWALHLYQTWWLKGSVAMTWPDTLFWSVLAVLVLLNSLWEMKRGRQRRLSSGYTVKAALGLALRTAATFACVSLLWSLWSSPTLAVWVAALSFADWHTALWGAAVLAVIMAATLAFEVMPSMRRKPAPQGERSSASAMSIGRSLLQAAAPLALVYVIASPGLQARISARALQPLKDAVNTGDSMVDGLEEQNGGYYGQLLSADPADAQRWETLNFKRVPKVYRGEEPIRRVRDLRFFELLPNVQLQAYDTQFSTNRWGMRDGDYPLAKPAGTVRIAVMGASHAMGWGVEGDKVFESILEQRLNAEPPRGMEHQRFEVLNFSVYGYSPLAQLTVFEDTVSRFRPDIVLLVAHTLDFEWVTRDVARSVRERMPLPGDLPATIAAEAAITPRTNKVIAMRRLAAYQPALLEWSYTRLAHAIRGIGATPATILLPIPGQLNSWKLLGMNVPEAVKQAGIIRRSGMTLIDLTRLYDNEEPRALMVAEPLQHSNAKAHAMIAGALYQRLAADSAIGLRPSTSPTLR